MVRAVKTKQVRSLSKGQRAILLPGATGAEPWGVWVMGGKSAPQLIQTCATPLDNRLRKETTLALPVAQVYCVPLWLNEIDSKQFAGMIPLQLELRGLQPRNEPAIFDWTIVAQDGARTLVMVGVLPSTLAPEIHAESFEAFDLAARYLPFPSDAVTIWKEQDRLAFAITRGPYLVYFQALTEGEITPRVLQDLSCAKATLDMQDILTRLERLVLWTPVTPTELDALQGVLSLPIEQEERPDPISPGQTWKLTPASVGEARRKRESSKWLRRGLLAVLLIYMLGTGWLVTKLIMTSVKVDALHKWQSAHAAAVELVLDGRDTWKELSPVVDTDNYPLELLKHTTQSIPADQLHLTLFEAGEDHLLIKGEAKNVAAAFQFFDKLKNDTFFSSYTLNMDNPRPLPNDLAQFQIQGTRATTN
jgi:hypothetical protein